MKKLKIIIFGIIFLLPAIVSAASFNYLKGRILLQTESRGEAWYYNPVDLKRYFLGNPTQAFSIMKSLGLGISNNNFNNLNKTNLEKLKGRIILKTEDNGKAYYIDPANFNIYYLGRPSDAFKVMRDRGLGISNKDIINIFVGDLEKKSNIISVNNININNPQVFSWNFKNNKYSIIIDVNQSLYASYKTSQKAYVYSGYLKNGWREDYYGMFLNLKPGDTSISYLADQFKKIAEQNKLSNDDLADLAVSFIQAIPYNKEKGADILAGKNNQKANYPYETLYERTGVCSDKTFLGVLLLRKLGFGAAIFDYPSIKHTALAILCNKEDSTYGDNYCYVETTNFFPIGVVPKTINVGLANSSSQFSDIFKADNLGTVEVYQKSSGSLYNGIDKTRDKAIIARSIETQSAADQAYLANLKVELDNKMVLINELAQRIQEIKNITEYNKATITYNNLAREYNDLANNYKLKIDLYNANISKYNSIIKEFYNK